MTHLNDISKVYMEKVAAKPDFLDLDKDGDKKESMKKASKDKMKTEALDPVGKEDADIDNDGIPNDKNDKYISRRRKAVARAIAKRKVSEATKMGIHSPHEVPSTNLKGLVSKAVKRIDTDVDGDVESNDKTKGEFGEFVPTPDGKGRTYTGSKKVRKESFSNWREDLREIIDTEEKSKPIKEKKVNNKIIVNPDLKEQVQILESFEISEEYINETINGAVDYFVAEGLNEDGVEILIDELGLDEFVSFVFEIGNEVISEARAGGVKIDPKTKGGKPVGSLKGGAKTAAIKRLRKEKAARREAEAKASESKPSGFKSFSQKHKAVSTAKKQQPSKKPVRDAIARGVFRAVDAYKAGMKRHKAAMGAAKETGKTIAKAAAVTHEAGRRAGQSKIGQAVKKAGSAAIKAGVEKAKKDIKSLKREEVEIDEAVYGGSKKEPKDTRYTVTAADKRGNTQAYKNFKAGDKRYKAADHLGERTLTKGEKSEREDYVKGMKKSKEGFKQRYGDRWKSVMYATATKMAKEEAKKPSALDIVKQQVIAKHGAASVVGTPENKAAKKAAEAKAKTQPKSSSKERYKDDVYSKDSLGGIRGYRSGD